MKKKIANIKRGIADYRALEGPVTTGEAGNAAHIRDVKDNKEFILRRLLQKEARYIKGLIKTSAKEKEKNELESNLSNIENLIAVLKVNNCNDFESMKFARKNFNQFLSKLPKATGEGLTPDQIKYVEARLGKLENTSYLEILDEFFEELKKEADADREYAAEVEKASTNPQTAAGAKKPKKPKGPKGPKKYEAGSEAAECGGVEFGM